MNPADPRHLRLLSNGGETGSQAARVCPLPAGSEGRAAQVGDDSLLRDAESGQLARETAARSGNAARPKLGRCCWLEPPRPVAPALGGSVERSPHCGQTSCRSTDSGGRRASIQAGACGRLAMSVVGSSEAEQVICEPGHSRQKVFSTLGDIYQLA